MSYDSALPLPALLSQLLVAFTIEFDNEFEHQMPHSTTRYGASSPAGGPWLVSMAMWWNCMRFVGEDGVRVSDLAALARTNTNLKGMVRWGYIAIEPDAESERSKPAMGDWIIRAKPKGRKARQVWAPLTRVIEERWRERFGAEAFAGLCAALQALVRQFDIDFPDCMPILGYGFVCRGPGRVTRGGSVPERLPALLARVLVAFAISFEKKSKLSLAVSINVIRVMAGAPVAVKDLPRLGGISKEAISSALKVLENGGYAVVGPGSANSRFKVVWLTEKGQQAWAQQRELIRRIEEGCAERFGREVMERLRAAAEGIASEKLWLGLAPYEDGWRAQVERPEVLPWFPMVLHRGGFPDGS